MLERDQGAGFLISPSGGLETTGRSVGDDEFRPRTAMNDNYRATGIVPTKTSSDVGSLRVTGPVLGMFLFDLRMFEVYPEQVTL